MNITVGFFFSLQVLLAPLVLDAVRRRQDVVPVDEGSAAGVVYPAVDEVAQEDDEGELAQLGPLSPQHVVAVVVGAALAQLGVGAPRAKGLWT